jgi:hypothetical protein
MRFLTNGGESCPIIRLKSPLIYHPFVTQLPPLDLTVCSYSLCPT